MDFVLYIQEKWENVSCQYSHLFYHEYILNCSSALLESHMYWFLIYGSFPYLFKIDTHDSVDSWNI